PLRVTAILYVPGIAVGPVLGSKKNSDSSSRSGGCTKVKRLGPSWRRFQATRLMPYLEGPFMVRMTLPELSEIVIFTADCGRPRPWRSGPVPARSELGLISAGR